MTSDKKTISAKPVVKEEQKFFDMILVKNFRPVGDFKIIDVIDGEEQEPRDPDKAEMAKVWAGTKVRLGLDDAKLVTKAKIAERSDELTI